MSCFKEDIKKLKTCDQKKNQNEKQNEKQKGIESEKIIKTEDYEKEESEKLVADSEKGSDIEDINKPHVENELSLLQQEIMKNIKEFRVARSQWRASNAKTQTSKAEIKEGIDDSNLYRGRCTLLRKLGFKTIRLRNHAKTLRPLKYYTLRRKVSQTNLPDIKEEEEVKIKVLAETNAFMEKKEENPFVCEEGLESVSRVTSQSEPCIIGQTAIKIWRNLNKKAKFSEPCLSEQGIGKIPERDKITCEELQKLPLFETPVEKEQQEEVKPQKKKKWFKREKEPKNEKCEEDDIKKQDKVKTKGPNKKALENLKASKRKTKNLKSCKCISGKEVTFVIKGFCLCDKVNLKKLRLKKIYDDLCKPFDDEIKPLTTPIPAPAPIKSPQTTKKQEIKAADSVEVYKKKISQISKKERCEKEHKKDDQSKTKRMNSLAYCKPQKKLEKNKPTKPDSESLISLFENKPEKKSEMALTAEQQRKLNEDFKTNSKNSDVSII